MALRDDLDKETADIARTQYEFRDDPKVTKLIDDWIAKPENARRWDYIQNMPLERLQRKVAYEEAKKDRFRLGKAEEVREWLEQHPEVKREVERRTKDVDPEHKKAAELRVARALSSQREIRRTTGIGA